MNDKKIAARMAAFCWLALWTLLFSYLSPDFFKITYMDYFHQPLFEDQLWVLSDK